MLLLKTPVGSKTDQFTLRITPRFSGSQPPDDRFFSTGFLENKIWLEPTSRKDGLGVLSAADEITVTGHSLGGHLAALALRLFPGLFDQGVTFNAAGFDPSEDKLTDEFVRLFVQMLPQEKPAPGFASLQTLFTAESESARPGDDFDGIHRLVDRRQRGVSYHYEAPY